MTNEPSNKEILEAINSFSSDVDKRFDNLEGRIDGLETKIDSIENTVTRIKNQMATKDYLDEKMSDLRGDMVVLTRKEDTKFKELVKILRSKNVLDETEEKKILAMEPFPQLSL